MSLSIIPECYADTELINILGFKKSNHSPSIGEVANKMQKHYSTRLAIGVIDNDKPGSIPNYFQSFEIQSSFDDYEIKKLPNSQHYLIVLKPALEQFLLNISNSLGVSADNYGFSNLENLKRVTKKRNVSKNQDFTSFVNTLSQKKGSPLIDIKSFLQELII